MLSTKDKIRVLEQVLIPAVIPVLKKKNNNILFFKKADIDVETGHINLSACTRTTTALQGGDQLLLTYPLSITDTTAFLAPELQHALKKKVLPVIVHRSAAYYSFALWCLAYLDVDVFDVALLLDGSPRLYYFLDRCLLKDPLQRTLLYL